MASVASSEKLSGGEFFVKGWKGDEAEEVDICSSDENEEGVGEVGGGGEVGSQQLGKRKRALSPSGSSISRDTGGPCSSARPDSSCKRPSAREYRSIFQTKTDTSKGKERTDEGTSCMRNQQNPSQRDLKRKQIVAEELSPGPSFRDSGSGNLCSWNSQWVSCCRCKKWRRIPYDVDVEIAIWECKDNGWSAVHASCDYPQDFTLERLNDMIDHVCGLRVDLSAAATHATGSSLDEQLDSDDNGPHERAASQTRGRRSESEKGTSKLPEKQTCRNQTRGKPSESEKTLAKDVQRTSEETSKLPEKQTCRNQTRSESEKTLAKDVQRISGETSKFSVNETCRQCGLDGHMIYCSLCQSSYHVRCLNPPLIDPVAQGWHCEACSNRTGVELIYTCDNKESYYVKWKGRSHVHNSTLTEAELARLAPKKLTLLKKRLSAGKAVKWDPLWAEPQRFIAKRETEQTEWFVKWRGLSYVQCTWEPADSGICASERGVLLAQRYERWCEAANGPAVKPRGKLDDLSTRPEWMKGEKIEQHQLDMLIKLRECWLNRKQGIVLCKLNQEHMIAVLAFILWLCRVSCVREPILMVMPPEMLHLWDKKLNELDPDLDSVVFHGSPEAKQVIQKYEFDLIEGRPKFNIVISTFDSVISAQDLLNTFTWSTILVDEGHAKAGKSFFRSIGVLDAKSRLIFSTLIDPCKNNLQDLLDMLALFDQGRHEDGSLQLADVLEKLNEHVVYDHKAECSNFNREFWVPVQMSPVQIHRYCEILVEHYELLRSGNMSQGDAHLQNIVQLLQSCCCHPYIGTEKMIKSVEQVAPPEDYLRLGIRASGKLELLHRLLLQHHTDKKTVLILVQPNSSELKNILDDYLRQQFGSGSYVRIERRMDIKARQSALRELNDNDSRCFALLLDRNAPVHHQLKDVDAVFVYESDWNPWNDTTYLQSLGIGNKYRLYRLYACHSIEEKILLYARQGVNLSNLRNVSAKRFQEILQWGATLLFEMDNCNLKHGASTDARIGWEGVTEDLPIILSKHLVLLSDAEVKQLATTNIEATTCSEKLKSILSPREPSLEGDPLYGVFTNAGRDGCCSVESFWSLLLKEKHAEVMHLNEPKKLRKREAVVENESRKKAKLQQQRSIGETEALRDLTADAPGDADLSPGVCSVEAPGENSPNNPVDEEATSKDLEAASSTKSMREEQQKLLDILKPEIRLMCRSLEMPANVLGRAEELLDFAASNLRMNQNYLPELKLSLCWIAAEQLDVSFDLSGAASVILATYGTTVDVDIVAAVHLKLKDQFRVSLPQLFKSAAKPSEEIQRSPERVASDSSQELLPGRVQAEIDADTLERKKADLMRQKSIRIMQLLDFQKNEWCRLTGSKDEEAEQAKRVWKAECRTIELSNDVQCQKLLKLTEKKSELDAKLKAIEERHFKERQDLLIRQRSSRELENCVIASHLDRLRDGILPGPLPQLIRPVTESTQERLPSSQAEKRISPQRGQQRKTDSGKKKNSENGLATCGKKQVSHQEQVAREDTACAREQLSKQQPEVREGAACAREQVSKQQPEVRANEGDGESCEPQIIDERPSLAAQEQQPAEICNQPQSASGVRMTHSHVDGPSRVGIFQALAPEATGLQSRSLPAVAAVSTAQGQTQVYAPAIVTTSPRNGQLPQQSSASQQAQSRVQIQSHRSASPAQAERHLAPPRQTGAAVRSQTQNQDPASGAQRQTQFVTAPNPTLPMGAQSQIHTNHLASNQVHQQAPPSLRVQSPTVPLPSTNVQSQVQAAGSTRQVAVQDPLSNEEAKLIKERERTKKVYNEEVARIQLQYQQTMENVQRNFRQKEEAFVINLQKAAEQRRLADALRKRDRLGLSPRRPAADYVSQINSLAALQNSVSTFQSATPFQGVNQIPAQQPMNVPAGNQPVLPFLATGTRPPSPRFLPVHQHLRPDSGGQSRLERDQALAPATARTDHQPCLQFAAQRPLGAQGGAGVQQQPATSHFMFQQQPRVNQGSPGTEQPSLQQWLHQPYPPRTEHVNQHLRTASGGDAMLNPHVRIASPSSLDLASGAQFRFPQQFRTEQSCQLFRAATAVDCTGAEQLRSQQQTSQVRPVEQHLRGSEGRGGSEGASPQFRAQPQVRVPRNGEWPQAYVASPVLQARTGGELQASPHLHHQQSLLQRAPPPWNPPPQVLRPAGVNTNSVSHNIIIQNNNIVSNSVNTGAVTQAQANELRASSQNMYTSIGRQLQLGTATMLGLDPRLVPVRPLPQQQQQQQQQRLPQPYHVQLPLDGPAVMSERDYIYLSDDE